MGKSAEVRVYEDEAGEYRWSLVAKNGKIIADSAEGYGTRWKARRAARTLLATVSGRVSILDVIG